MKKELLRLAKTFLNLPNLLASAVVIFYYLLYNAFLSIFWATFAALSQLLTKTEIQDYVSIMVHLDTTFIPFIQQLACLGFWLTLFAFALSQILNYQKKNLSMLSVMMMALLCWALLWIYVDQFLRMQG